MFIKRLDWVYVDPDINVAVTWTSAGTLAMGFITGEDVGLSQNASTITARNEALRIFASLVEVQPTLVAASDSVSEEQLALNLVESLIERVPKPFNVHNFKKKFDLEE